MRYAILLLPALLAAGEADPPPAPPGPLPGEHAAPLQGGGEARDKMFKRLDKDGDGFLSLEELRAAHPGKAPAGSGKPPAAGERPPGEPPQGGAGEGGRPALPELFARLDTNGDGQLSPAEFAALPRLLPPPPGAEGRGPEEMLKRLDKDGDGRISREEFEQGGKRPDSERRRKPGKGDHEAGKGAEGEGQAPPPGL